MDLGFFPVLTQTLKAIPNERSQLLAPYALLIFGADGPAMGCLARWETAKSLETPAKSGRKLYWQRFTSLQGR
jgi:hypothetical protein